MFSSTWLCNYVYLCQTNLSYILAILVSPLPFFRATRVVEAWAKILPPIGFFGSAWKQLYRLIMSYKPYCFEVQTPKKFTNVFNGQMKMRIDEKATKLHSSYYYYLKFPVGWTDYDEGFSVLQYTVWGEVGSLKRVYLEVVPINFCTNTTLLYDWEAIFLQSPWYTTVIREIWSIKRRAGNLGILVHEIKNCDSQKH